MSGGSPDVRWKSLGIDCTGSRGLCRERPALVAEEPRSGNQVINQRPNLSGSGHQWTPVRDRGRANRVHRIDLERFQS